jgi:glyoxalase family protein
MASPPPLSGLHHVSALTAQVSKNVQFYTQILGLRLVLKTVNQDDPSSYHLFYGDETGSPGTDLTFFDVPHARDERPGSGLITGTSLRVRGTEVLDEWAQWLDEYDVRRTPLHERAGRRALTLYDEEGQCLHLVDDAADTDRVPETHPWTDGPVPAAQAIQGLGPVEVTVADMAPTRRALTDVFGFTKARPYEVDRLESEPSDADQPTPSPEDAPNATVFETGPGGVAAELHVVERPNDPRGWLGIGGVHHLALRTPNSDTIRTWREHIDDAGLDPTPVIDRHYFESVYTREPGGILIEIATDTGTPFPVEEAAVGTVSLPPSLEPKRASIEEALTPIGPATDDATTP